MATRRVSTTISKQIWDWSLTDLKHWENSLKLFTKPLPTTIKGESIPHSKCLLNNSNYAVWFKLFVQKTVYLTSIHFFLIRVIKIEQLGFHKNQYITTVC